MVIVNGTAERTTALDMIEDNAKSGSTVGGDKNYDTADFVAGCRNALHAARLAERRAGYGSWRACSAMRLNLRGRSLTRGSPPFRSAPFALPAKKSLVRNLLGNQGVRPSVA